MRAKWKIHGRMHPCAFNSVMRASDEIVVTVTVAVTVTNDARRTDEFVVLVHCCFISRKIIAG